MLQHYFKIQFRILNRHIQSSGIHPLVAWGLIALLIVFISSRLFNEESWYAPLMIIALPLAFLLKLNDKKRNEFLKISFNKHRYFMVRFLENWVITLPFLSILFIENEFWYACGLLVFATVLVLFKSTSFRFQIPNPVFKHSFEFIQGYRKSCFMMIFLYTIAIIGISVGNFNLSCVAFVINGLIPLSFFGKLEPHFFIWNYNLNAGKFIFQKIKIMVKYIFYWNLPLGLLICIFNMDQSLLLIGIMLYLSAASLNAMLCKYAQFPRSQMILYGILLSLSTVFFPLMLFSIPYFLKKSKKELKVLLP